MRRSIIGIATALLLGTTLMACDKDGGGDGGGEAGPNLDGPLMALADAAETHAQVNGNAFADSGVMSYCREGNSIANSLFEQIGYQAPAGSDGWLFCYAQSSDHRRVALSIATTASAAEFRCLVTDYSSGSPERSEMTTTASCTP